ncbi:MAG: DUF1449 family protein, partial [Cyanothece sp. SIO1E1]|nr:DUF1449 family protein [Cyanothece sp. SIO1E1]
LILLIAIDLSLWGLVGWMLNVGLGSILGTIPAAFLGVLVMSGSLAIALFLGGGIARPIGQIFAAFGENTRSDRLIGCQGTVTSATIPYEHSGKIGQVDVIDPARNLVTVSATTPQWATIALRRGAQVLVIEHHPRAYLVIAQDSPEQDRWLAGSVPAK